MGREVLIIGISVVRTVMSKQSMPRLHPSLGRVACCESRSRSLRQDQTVHNVYIAARTIGGWRVGGLEGRGLLPTGANSTVLATAVIRGV